MSTNSTCVMIILVQREMETKGSWVRGLGDIAQGSAYGFTATVASSRYGFLFAGSGPRRRNGWGHVDRGLGQRQAGVAGPWVEVGPIS